MRVRVLKRVTGYWNYGVQAWEPGEELSGELARHLVDNTPKGSVEVIEADPEPEPAEPKPEGPEGDGPEAPGAGESDGPPVDGTIDQLMAWVGDDPDKAAAALAAEQAKDKPRSTVVKRLAALAEE